MITLSTVDVTSVPRMAATERKLRIDFLTA